MLVYSVTFCEQFTVHCIKWQDGCDLCWKRMSWPILVYNSNIFRDELRKTVRTLQLEWPVIRDSILGPPTCGLVVPIS